MTVAQKIAAKLRYHRKAEAICPTCDGKGRILSESVHTRGRQGGNASYKASLEPGQLSMSDRGHRGGQPRALTIDDIHRMKREGLTSKEVRTKAVA